MHPPTAADAVTGTLCVTAGVLARVAAAVVVGTLPVLTGVSLRIRVALAISLAFVAAPAACAARAVATTGDIGPLLPLVAGELLVGIVLGTAVAAALATTAWAGGLLGTVSGLSWADDFDPDAAGEMAGVSRLAWWVGLAAFCAAGGQLAVVGGLVDSVRLLPIGGLADGNPPEWLRDLAIRTPAAACSLATLMAMPALVAVVAFHLAVAICLRTIPCTTGPGLVQGLASVVLLGCLWLGAEAWAGGGAVAMLGLVESCFTGR